MVENEYAEMYKALIDMVLSGSDFAVALSSHVDLGKDAKERLGADTGLVHFEQLLKSSKPFFNAISKAEWLSEVEAPTEDLGGDFAWGAHCAKLNLVTYYKKLLTGEDVVDVVSFKAAHVSETTTLAIQHIQEVAKSYHEANENSWKYTLPEEANIEKVMELAKRTLDTLNLEHMENGLNALSKAGLKQKHTQWTFHCIGFKSF